MRGKTFLFLMRINQRVKDFLIRLLGLILGIGILAASVFGLVLVINAIWWLIDNVFITPVNFFGFIGIIYIILAFGFTIKNSLKENKKELTKKNIISETGLQLLIAGLFILVIYFIFSVWSNPYLIFLLPIIFLGYRLIYKKG